jgi:Zn-dependent protease
VLLEPTPSPFDLRWRMFGIGVRVHPSFWIFSAIFGWTFEQLFGLGGLAVWVGCMFVSILWHELGHVFMGRMCGQNGHIVLYSFGGLAIGHYHQVSPWRRIAIAAAGPAAGFLLYGLVSLFDDFAMMRIDPTFGMPYLRLAVRMLYFMNFLWSVLNLIPVFPLDGGQISRELCMLFSRRNGLRLSLGLSFLIAGLIAVYSAIVKMRPPGELWFPSFGLLGFDPLFTAIMFGLMAMQSYMQMQAVERERRRWENDQEPW